MDYRVGARGYAIHTCSVACFIQKGHLASVLPPASACGWIRRALEDLLSRRINVFTLANAYSVFTNPVRPTCSTSLPASATRTPGSTPSAPPSASIPFGSILYLPIPSAPPSASNPMPQASRPPSTPRPAGVAPLHRKTALCHSCDFRRRVFQKLYIDKPRRSWSKLMAASSSFSDWPPCL